jgi:hypothetical protein
MVLYGRISRNQYPHGSLHNDYTTSAVIKVKNVFSCKIVCYNYTYSV